MSMCNLQSIRSSIIQIQEDHMSEVNPKEVQDIVRQIWRFAVEVSTAATARAERPDSVPCGSVICTHPFACDAATTVVWRNTRRRDCIFVGFYELSLDKVAGVLPKPS